ncbi:MAG: ATP-binding protein [Candidatus Omnitrophota bacterium]|nr:ATP-binding protein [Candidatus Omnitrophota bacterium]
MPREIILSDLKSVTESIHSKELQAFEKSLLKFVAAYIITKEISLAIDLENSLNVLSDRVSEFLSVEIVSIMLISKNKNELLIKLAKGLDRQIVRDAKIKLGEGVSGWVAQTGEALLIKDITKDSRFLRRNGKYHTDSLLSVPLKIKDKVIGVINVNNKFSKNIFNDEDLGMLQTVADLAVISVNNAYLQEDAKALDQLRSDFIANVSHELRTPLATVKETVALILDRVIGDVNDKQEKVLGLARKSIERLERLIDDLLDFSKAESKIKEMHRTLFDIGMLLSNATETLIPLAAKKNIVITTNLPHEKIEVWGDEDKLCEVILNLIDNAIKYNRLSGKIEVNCQDMDKFIKVCISDSGIGIAPEDLDRIFDRFYRIEHRVKDKVKGTGLGLYITKEIIQAHGGEITVESEYGQGSNFIISLPKNLRLWQ